MKLRIQVTIYHTLVAEMVGADYAEIELFWNNWVNTRIKQGLDAGGATIGRADLPRIWDVAIGEDVRPLVDVQDRR